MSAIDDDLVELQTKQAWHDDKLDSLNEALIDKEKRITALEERIERLERALTILAQRQATPAMEIAGAHDVDDPVPRSG